MHSPTTSTWLEHQYPFTNNISFTKVTQQVAYKKVIDFLDKKSLHSTWDLNAFFEKLSGETVENLMKELALDPDELRLLKQVLNNNICLIVFEKFAERTANIRKDGNHLPIPSLTEAHGIDAISIKDVKNLYGSRAMQYLFLTKIMVGWYSDKVSNLVNDSVKITWIQWKLMFSKLATWVKSRYDFPIKFYTEFFIRSWHLIFIDMLNSFFNDTDNKDLARWYVFLENILMRDLANKQDWNTFTSDTYHLMPNTNLSELMTFIDNSEWAMYLGDIESFLRRQTQKNIKDSLDKDGHLLAGPDSRKKIIIDWVAHIKEKTRDSLPLPTFWGCPFAKTKTSEWKNAFLEMYTLFNEWYIVIIKQLADNNLISLKDYPTTPTSHSA
jgi:hypothetical protein